MVAHWGFFEWLTYGLIALAAIISAADLALKHAPMISNRVPGLIRGPLFGILPFMALIGSAVLIGLNQFGVIHTASDPVEINGSLPVRFQQGAMPPWLQVAIGEYDETRSVNGKHNPRIGEYLKSIPGNDAATDQDDWASAFVEWSLNHVGISGPKSQSSRAWATWGREVKRPELGAIAVFNFQGTEHVGFVLGETADSLIIVGGNEVDRVEARRYYKRDKVTYRMPQASH
jgi:uncharacterized protein (TIGR02594 family)